MPELNDQDEDDVVQDLSPYELTVVLPRDPRAQTASLPPYVVMPCALFAYWARIRSSDSHPEVKILDFGNGAWALRSMIQTGCADQEQPAKCTSRRASCSAPWRRVLRNWRLPASRSRKKAQNGAHPAMSGLSALRSVCIAHTLASAYSKHVLRYTRSSQARRCFMGWASRTVF